MACRPSRPSVLLQYAVDMEIVLHLQHIWRLVLADALRVRVQESLEGAAVDAYVLCVSREEIAHFRGLLYFVPFPLALIIHADDDAQIRTPCRATISLGFGTCVTSALARLTTSGSFHTYIWCWPCK